MPGHGQSAPGPGVQYEGHRAGGALAHLGRQLGLYVVQVAEEGDEEPVAAAFAVAAAAHRVVGPGEPGAVGVPDHGEGVHHQPGGLRGLLPAGGEPAAALAGHRVAGVGEQARGEALFQDVHEAGGGRGDGPFEGGVGARAVEGEAAGVEQDRGPAALGLFLAADHQLAVAGGGAPVHAAQVVAAPVAARDHVVVAGQGQGAAAAVAVAVGLAGQPDRGQGFGARYDGEGVVGAEGARQFDQPEGVGQPQLERAQRVAAAQVGADPVGHLAAAAGLDPVQDEPRARAQYVGHPVLEHQQAGGQPGDVVHAQLHPGLGARGHPPGGQPAAAGDPVAGAVQGVDADQRQEGEEQADAQQCALAEDVGAGGRGDPGGHERAAAGGQPGQRGAQSAAVSRAAGAAWGTGAHQKLRAPAPGGISPRACAAGTGVRWRISPTTCSEVRRFSWACAVGSSR